MYQHFIGIDISKNDFSVAVFNKKEVKRFANRKEGFAEFCFSYGEILSNSLIILETTGGYELSLIEYLQNQGCAVHRANTRKVKHFIKSLGKIAKTDAIDAKALARYGYERQQELALFCEHPQKKLLKLVQRRNDLKQMLVQEKNRRQAPDQRELVESFDKIIGVLESQIEVIEKEMEKIVVSDELFKKKEETLQSLKGIGKITAMQLLALMPELGRLNGKKIASLAGLAPHPYESGKKIGYRCTQGGRKEVKRILFMSAMTAAKSNTVFGDFYKRLLAAGKKKMVALTALMRKILVVANAKIRDLFIKENVFQHG